MSLAFPQSMTPPDGERSNSGNQVDAHNFIVEIAPLGIDINSLFEN